ncbi:conserved membrane hypothetical protein [uncultured Paludibacter sp.]|uniref:Uncharacterized protein n=1 Tax=uncultured Paludibacter sp. TaxID=497635 RepID=A0A653ACD5_9BACT|nr:conserved membrane hypothetical protein [uncultured Paludibacter sp.]
MEAQKNKITLKSIWKVLKTAFKGFVDDKVTKLSAALSYATIFSIAPFFVILITIGSYFFGREAVEGQLYSKIEGFVGTQLAENIQSIIQNATISTKSFWSTASGILVVLVGATTVFSEIQDSLNIIWGIKPKPKKGWLLMIRNRLLSFSLILSIGFVLLVSFLISYIFQLLNERLIFYYPDVAVIIFSAITFLLNAIITCFLFGLIFKMLPDAKIKLKDVMVGAIVTTILFLIGQKLISIYMSYSNPGSVYGAAAFVILIMLWVYYSSIILYFGAEFTKSWAVELGNNIYPDEYAVSTKIIEVQKENIKPLESLNKTEIDTTTTEGKKEATQNSIKEKANEHITLDDEKTLSRSEKQ